MPKNSKSSHCCLLPVACCLTSARSLLHFKKVGKFWSARIGINYRALAFKDGEDYIWVWIGTHDEYEQILKREG
jgi:steroid 5-alpha reductase family enzyme